MRNLTLMTTGGTIEKTYDEFTGRLENRQSILGLMLESLRLEKTSIRRVELLSKDSLDMTDADRERIVKAVAAEMPRPRARRRCHGVVILHGTDTLCVTGEALHAAFPRPPFPIVLVGAMRPYEMQRSDALQNLTEAIFATAVLEPGTYAVAHGRALRFPGVRKDRARGTFVK